MLAIRAGSSRSRTGAGPPPGIRKGFDLPVGDDQFQGPFRFLCVPEAEGPGVDQEAAGLTGIGPGLGRRVQGAIIQTVEFALEDLLAQGAPDIEFQGPGIDPGRQGPALALELDPHDPVEVGPVEDHPEPRHQTKEQAPADHPAEQPAQDPTGLAAGLGVAHPGLATVDNPGPADGLDLDEPGVAGCIHRNSA